MVNTAKKQVVTPVAATPVATPVAQPALTLGGMHAALVACATQNGAATKVTNSYTGVIAGGKNAAELKNGKRATTVVVLATVAATMQQQLVAAGLQVVVVPATHNWRLNCVVSCYAATPQALQAMQSLVVAAIQAQSGQKPQAAATK